MNFLTAGEQYFVDGQILNQERFYSQGLLEEKKRLEIFPT
jgi:hypothetical protein